MNNVGKDEFILYYDQVKNIVFRIEHTFKNETWSALFKDPVCTAL